MIGYAKPRLTVVDKTHEGAAFDAVRQGEGVRGGVPSRGGRRGRPRPRGARPACHLLDQRQHRHPQGRRPVAPHQLAAGGVDDRGLILPDGHAAEAVCMFPLFHWAGWSNLLNALADPLRPPYTLGAGSRATARHRRTSPGHVAVLHPRRSGAGSSPAASSTASTASSARSTPAPRRCRWSCSPSIKAAFPGTRPASAMARPKVAPAPTSTTMSCSTSPVRSGAPTSTSSCAWPTTTRCACERLPHGRLLRAARRHRRSPRRRLVPHRRPRSLDDEGFVWIVGGPGTCSEAAGRPWHRARSKRSSRLLAVAEVAVVGLPDVRWGEIVCAVVVPVDGRSGERASRRFAPTAGRLALSSSRGGSRSLHAPPHAHDGQIQRTLLVERITGPSRS